MLVEYSFSYLGGVIRMEDRQKIKIKILKAMYKSVDRMNHHVLKGNSESASAEYWLQVNLRNDFSKLGLTTD